MEYEDTDLELLSLEESLYRNLKKCLLAVAPLDKLYRDKQCILEVAYLLFLSYR